MYHWKLHLSCSDTMNTRKHLLCAARYSMPTIGLSLISAGAYIKSIQNEQVQILRDISTYLFIILGFILLVIGVLWSLGHGMKNVLLKRALRRSRDADVLVFTVDSMGCAGPAPPVYTLTCYENSFEDFSHEEPPTYQQAVLQSQAESQAARLATNSFVEPV
ncbi:uncharacterized protein LOC124400307 isoform X2 [Silurus meridionalis]|uniref:uncharacterized protein LOC124400307 isoform X2 n=1 Tax=Silurus meridionalis TaxID=175797 RepID=UPI001EEB4015|nr:uncharacterized protein LOC124400307 isoform X2 [Silurus meridionalis]